MENNIVVVVVPFVAQGHLNQLLHLSRLLAAYNLPVHIAGTTTHNRQAKLRIQGWNHNSHTNIHFHEFETPQKQWALGPFNPVSISKDEDVDYKRHKSLEWLDKQAQDSVIYVAFGSTTSFSDEQIQELAIGLENSGQKFIWVLRDADKGDIFKGEGRNIELPKGFEERLGGKGLVVREWAPQLELLAHIATGGFMSHCGWNSSIESISMGVPIAAWPMHSEQPKTLR
ncbi:hypothetical protein SSX86_022558 [Deinandra increscens subsp. villosa]|uniref:Glycosyltransferase N-terminal domain-containing protein n=1 Tax=Deinandra increscens subsp. villosa TaxID=3103831 RepID=A0AAP0CP71_9ASTR